MIASPCVLNTMSSQGLPVISTCIVTAVFYANRL